MHEPKKKTKISVSVPNGRTTKNERKTKELKASKNWWKLNTKYIYLKLNIYSFKNH